MLDSKITATPMHTRECNYLCDGGATFVVASADVVRASGRPAAWVWGMGSRVTNYSLSQERAARIQPADVKLAEIYDSYPVYSLITLEELGLVPLGKAGQFVLEGNTWRCAAMSYTLPLPQQTPWSLPFWAGARRGELIMYPRYFCPRCMGREFTWTKAAGRGTLYSFSEKIPYVVAIIRLEEGVQMMSNLVDYQPEDLRCDLPVEVVFDPVTPEVTLPKFRPVRGG